MKRRFLVTKSYPDNTVIHISLNAEFSRLGIGKEFILFRRSFLDGYFEIEAADARHGIISPDGAARLIGVIGIDRTNCVTELVY